MRNIKIIVEYDGTDYYGFQRQPGRRTIQGELERALHRITKERVTIVGAGRTDAGVHALGQVASFRTEGTIPIDRIPIAVNSLVDRDLVVKSAEEVDPRFHARYSVKSRVYRYKISNRDMPSALNARFVWQVRGDLNTENMAAGAQFLIGTHDFTSFCSPDNDTPGRVRNLFGLTVARDGDQVECVIAANAFLHNMVRVIVGTLVEVGQGRRRPEEISAILEAKDRRFAGRTAPPQGLALTEVKY